MKVLVVCSANLARSQAIAHYLEQYSKESNISLEIQSAGVNIELIEKLIKKNANSFTLTDRMITALDKLSKGQSNRTKGYSKPITKELVQWADKIITVDSKTKENIQKMFPNSAKKLFLAKEMAAGKVLPINAGFKDSYAQSKARRYRRGTKQSTLTNPQPKSFWLMVNEAKHISKGIIRRLR